ncbi:hypothetical protein Tsp_01497 [Trichinella spiralis]|nr:hypothetical protein Tsp_01497 [Trichinella spiralis]
MIIPVRIIPTVNGKFKNVASSSVFGTSVEAIVVLIILIISVICSFLPSESSIIDKDSALSITNSEAKKRLQKKKVVTGDKKRSKPKRHLSTKKELRGSLIG